ncbi:YfhO family protein [bacterium]|nr:YfhO family protein [bacterium]
MGTEELLKVDTGSLLRLRVRRRPLLSNRNLDLASILLLLVLTIFFFAGVLFSDKYAIPWDMIDYYYPSQFYTIESIKNGSFPLWNPHILSGFPTIADPENAVFYPLNLFLYLFSVNSPVSLKTVETFLALHYFLTGLFMWIFLRSLSLKRYAALSGAIMYMFSGYLAAHAQHLGPIMASTWIPLILYYCRKSILEKNKRHVIKAGLLIGVQILAGYPQTTFSTLLALLIYFGWHSIRRAYNIQSWRPVIKAGHSFLLMFLTGISVAAIQLVPTIQLHLHSIRSEIIQDYSQLEQFPLHPIYLITTIVANFFGGLFGSESWFPRDITEGHLYLGIIPIMLIVIGIKCTTKKNVMWLIIGSFFFVLALGGYTIWPRIYYHVSPYLNFFARSSNYFLITNLCAAIFAAYGMQLILADTKNPEIYIALRGLKVIFMAFIGIFAIMAATILFLDNGGLRQRIISIQTNLLLCVFLFVVGNTLIRATVRRKVHIALCKTLLLSAIIIDLFTFNSHQPFDGFRMPVNTIVSPNSLEGNFPPLAFLRQDSQKNYRIATFESGSTYFNGGSITGFQNIFGYTTMALGSYRDYLAEFGMKFSRKPKITQSVGLDNNYMNLLSAKYLLVGPDVLLDKKVNIPSHQYMLVSNKSLNIFFNKKFIPRAFIAEKAIITDVKHKRSTYLQSASFQPRDFVLIDSEFKNQIPRQLLTELTSPNELTARGDNRTSQSIKIVESKGNSVKIAANLDAPGFVVLTDVNYPGWKAYDRGKEREILPAYGLFRAIALEKGQHSIEFRFEPKIIYVGLVITLISFLLATTYLLSPYLPSLRRNRIY